MAGIYPSLQEKFKNEGICPICMMPMGLTPRYTCVNDHVVCHRCKPYYYACPDCRSPMDIEIFPPVGGVYEMPPVHYLAQPYPQYPAGTDPSAPFMEHERHSWGPPTPTEDQELKHCGFCFAGCEARFPEHLRNIHEARCQFRPNLENEQLPTDLSHDDDELRDCRFRSVGCNVRVPEWRKWVHEDMCIYKEKVGTIDGMIGTLEQLSFEDTNSRIYDPEEMVNCRYKRHGCMVKMPRRRKSTHESKCNYSKYGDGEDEVDETQILVTHEDPDERIPCIWAEHGCQVVPRRCKKHTHEEICNYRREHCSYRYKGCNAQFQPPRRYAHEKNCEYA